MRSALANLMVTLQIYHNMGYLCSLGCKLKQKVVNTDDFSPSHEFEELTVVAGSREDSHLQILGNRSLLHRHHHVAYSM